MQVMGRLSKMGGKHLGGLSLCEEEVNIIQSALQLQQELLRFAAGLA